MKITKSYLKQIIKEEYIKVLSESERKGNVIFDNQFVAFANAAKVNLDDLAKKIEAIANLKSGQKVIVTMDDSGIKWNGIKILKGADEQAIIDFAARLEQKKQQLQSSQPQNSTKITFAGKNPLSFTSPNGGKPVHFFTTDQGSEYLLTDDGMLLRNKSFHANTGGEDAGLQKWSEKVEFYDGNESLIKGGIQNFRFPDAISNLLDKGIIALSKTVNGERVALIIDNNQWRPAIIADAMPKAAKYKPEWANIVIKAKNWSFEPKVGWQPFDYSEKNNILKRVHNGSLVDKVQRL